MIDKNTDFFKYVDNFAKLEHIPSVTIFESSLDYIPKITIAIPTYKRVDLLKEAIDSAVNQEDYSDYDIIVVDNNPERGCETEQLMGSYSNTKISYYKNSENLGMTGNWNRLFTLAKGDYVVMLHDDDLLLPCFIREVNSLSIKLKDFGQIKPLNFKWYENKSLLPDKIPEFDGRISYVRDLDFYYGNHSGVPSGVLYDKEKVVNCGGFNPDFYPTADYCFNVLFSKKNEVFIINKYMSIYRIGYNESLNYKTLESFIKNDFFLIYQLLKEYRIPHFILINFLRHRSCRQAELYKKVWYNNFDFDTVEKLNIKRISRSKGILYHILVKFYIIFKRLSKLKLK